MFAKELKKLWNMKVTVMPIVIRALETTPKGIRRLRKKRTIGNSIIKIGQIRLEGVGEPLENV